MSVSSYLKLTIIILVIGFSLLGLGTLAQIYYTNTNNSNNTSINKTNAGAATNANANMLNQNSSVNTNTAPTPVVTKPVNITTDQVAAAGFTGVTKQATQGNAFLPPVFYFRVKEAVVGPNGAAWGSAANLVAVLVRPKYDRNWSYNNGQMEIIDYAGRTQARISSTDYYIVVTGPDRDKVLRLANNLKAIYD